MPLITFQTIESAKTPTAHILVGNAYFGYLTKPTDTYTLVTYDLGLRSQPIPYIEARRDGEHPGIATKDDVYHYITEALSDWHERIMAAAEDPEPPEQCDLCSHDLPEHDDICPRDIGF